MAALIGHLQNLSAATHGSFVSCTDATRIIVAIGWSQNLCACLFLRRPLFIFALQNGRRSLPDGCQTYDDNWLEPKSVCVLVPVPRSCLKICTPGRTQASTLMAVDVS